MLQEDYLRSIKGYNYGIFKNLRPRGRRLIGAP
jgi:hypothetical protein